MRNANDIRKKLERIASNSQVVADSTLTTVDGDHLRKANIMRRQLAASLLVSSGLGFVIWTLSPLVTVFVAPSDASFKP